MLVFAVLMLVLWVVLAFVVKVGSALVHTLLVLAVIALILKMVGGNRGGGGVSSISGR